MVQLKQSPNNNYYYVANDTKTIYEIMGNRIADNADGIFIDAKTELNGIDLDEQTISDKVSVPCFITKNSDNIYHVYFLDNLIEDGDKCEKSGDKYKFSKRLSNTNTYVTYLDYYKTIVEDYIKTILLSQPITNNLVNFVKKQLPDYMVSGGSMTVVKSNETTTFQPINITENYLKTAMQTAVKEASFKAAKDLANKYGYNITNNCLVLS